MWGYAMHRIRALRLSARDAFSERAGLGCVTQCHACNLPRSNVLFGHANRDPFVQAHESAWSFAQLVLKPRFTAAGTPTQAQLNRERLKTCEGLEVLSETTRPQPCTSLNIAGFLA